LHIFGFGATYETRFDDRQDWRTRSLPYKD